MFQNQIIVYRHSNKSDINFQVILKDTTLKTVWLPSILFLITNIYFFIYGFYKILYSEQSINEIWSLLWREV